MEPEATVRADIDPVLKSDEITEKTFKDTDAGKNIVRCNSADEMFELLDL